MLPWECGDFHVPLPTLRSPKSIVWPHTPMGVARGVGGCERPLLGKSLKLTVKIRYTENIFEKIFQNDRENPGFFENTTPFSKSWRRPCTPYCSLTA
jgi:hypothetical protein